MKEKSIQTTLRIHGMLFAILALLVSGCATSSPRSAHGPAPAACTDSLYVQLSRQHPDSMSERVWQRFQALDSACARARTQAVDASLGMGMMGMGHGGGRAWTILAALVMVGMATAMVAFRL